MLGSYSRKEYKEKWRANEKRKSIIAKTTMLHNVVLASGGIVTDSQRDFYDE